jgi:hypothetical protein
MVSPGKLRGLNTLETIESGQRTRKGLNLLFCCQVRTGLYGESGETLALNTLETIESGQRTRKGLNLLAAVR